LIAGVHGSIALMDIFGLLFVLLIQTAKPAPVAGLPAETGIYFRQGDGWQRLQPATMAEMKSKGVGMFLETDGLAGLDLTMNYAGAHAGVQIGSPQPVFYIRGFGSAKDALIVQLTQKKDSRSIRTSSVDITVENKGGFKKDVIRHVAVTEFSDGSFSVTPNQKLKPGEYLLVFGHAITGHDFGITKAAR
jgi:hypothetical protein